jgi:hypothetical protein
VPAYRADTDEPYAVYTLGKIGPVNLVNVQPGRPQTAGPPQERTPLQNLPTDLLLPRTSAESGPDPAPRHGVAHNPLTGSQRRYGTCWLASGDTIVTWNDSGLAA